MLDSKLWTWCSANPRTRQSPDGSASVFFCYELIIVHIMCSSQDNMSFCVVAIAHFS